eukprot:3868614-Amphidinium_carterae.1
MPGASSSKGKQSQARSLEVLMNMRLTEVHKPLASAHRALRQNIVLTGEGGVLSPKDSLPGRELERYANELWFKHQRQAIPLYQENGVYNLYVRPSADLSAIETASAVGAGLSGQRNLGATSTEAASAALPLSGAAGKLSCKAASAVSSGYSC